MSVQSAEREKPGNDANIEVENVREATVFRVPLPYLFIKINDFGYSLANWLERLLFNNSIRIRVCRFFSRKGCSSGVSSTGYKHTAYPT